MPKKEDIIMLDEEFASFREIERKRLEEAFGKEETEQLLDDLSNGKDYKDFTDDELELDDESTDWK